MLNIYCVVYIAVTLSEIDIHDCARAKLGKDDDF